MRFEPRQKGAQFMNGLTINIAEFRCRATSRVAATSNRPVKGLAVVSLDAASDRWETNTLQEAVLQDDPPIYDIGLAREAQRLRHRAVFRPAGLERKAKILRFRNERSAQFKVRLEETRAMQSRSGMPDGPRDLPPAA
jgi:hypothetical protein